MLENQSFTLMTNASDHLIVILMDERVQLHFHPSEFVIDLGTSATIRSRAHIAQEGTT